MKVTNRWWKLPSVEVGGARPRVVKRNLALLASGAILAAGVTVANAPEAQACGAGVYFGGSGGEYCDTDHWPDGSYLHRERVCVLGICGSNVFRACHHDPDGPGPAPAGRVPTDLDPSTPC